MASHEEYDEGEDEGEDEEDDDSLMPRALPVGEGGIGDDPSAPPTDAFEYLRRVRKEASTLPGVVRANINPREFDDKRTRYTPAVSSTVSCDTHLLPESDWEKSEIGRAVQQECRDRSRMPSSA
eukprot:TRINITY_DN111008_c0_g1_i1.p1 TRINITY_DN111008_c0_g1~~TRINITY_DN111008_c0_g1_i1.p1  ORF type:complete len:124 (-),score=24.19 TRINITY_DN111008_c0_g1_i1:11-382(-)